MNIRTWRVTNTGRDVSSCVVVVCDWLIDVELFVDICLTLDAAAAHHNALLMIRSDSKSQIPLR